MSFFSHLHKKAGKGSEPIKTQNLQIRREVVKPIAKSGISKVTAPSSKRRNVSSSTADRQLSVRTSEKSTADKGYHGLASRSLKSRSNGRNKQPSPAPPLFSPSSEDNDSAESSEGPRKRLKISSSSEPDLKRLVRSKQAFSEDDKGVFAMVHAAEIASLEEPNKFNAAFGESSTAGNIFLQYPSASQQERYELVAPNDRHKDEFKPLEDIIQVIEHVARYYLPEADSEALTNDSTGLLRRLRRSITRRNEEDFQDIIAEYNHAIIRLRKIGTIAKSLDGKHSLELALIKRILDQTYSRTVSLRVASLKQYQNGTDNVYGELLPRFISKIFKDTGLKSEHLFIDLGSGVGNVVLQAALEVGCESWGCEMMDTPCDLAELQEREFKARCRLWGLAIGDIHLERGDFLANMNIRKMLPKADVLLVNNQAFTPGLNDSLLHLFLDLKEGCQIVSLKSFVPSGHKLTTRNMGSPVNLLDVHEKQYFSASVSWTDAGGTYCVARKDSSRLRNFEESVA
ncbi:MAG: Nucleosomal histone H3-Lys79 methylase [Candelaria pacifica]|nr:MAG: Nucleosomal histone H3-Lys79 methylase [Candelaria pacifica]